MEKRIISLATALLLLLTLTACGGGGSSDSGGDGGKGNVTVNFMYGGDISMAGVYSFLIEEFNKTVGKEQGITVKPVPKSGSLDAVAGQQLPGRRPPDVISLSDEYFKKHTRYLEPLDDVISGDVYNDLYKDMRRRYRYSIEDTTSNDDDPLYGVPVYNDTTVLFYNKTAMEKAHIIVISVPEEDLASFNAGGKDKNGKTKADYGITVNVPAKGFYRSGTPYVSNPNDRAGSSWRAPAAGETLIFNDRIAMNWDETEDLGMILTKSRNSASPTTYGYYTEWWFNYGWSVGGDCEEDVSGNGDWVYSLPMKNPNYIVQDGKTYKGVYTGTTYSAGETLDVKDVLAASPGDKISTKTDGKTYYYYTVNGNEATYRDFSAELSNGTLKQLPSIYDAFSRFCFLAGVGGLNVCPYPSAFSGRTSTAYFTSGVLAMLVERVHQIDSIESTMADGNEYSIAPLPRYKEYNNPSSPNDDSVKVKGREAAHSIGYGASVAKNSRVKEQALVFLKWLATDGQKALAENGYVSSRQSDKDTCVANLKFRNPDVVMDSISVCNPGDWWYMPDRSWIDYWANPLNSNVRYGKMTFEDYIYAYVEGSNSRLAAYKK